MVVLGGGAAFYKRGTPVWWELEEPQGPEGFNPGGHRSPQVHTFRSFGFKGREFFIDNLLVRIHFIIVMIRWTGLAPWEFEFPFQGSLTSTFLGVQGPSAPEMGQRCWCILAIPLPSELGTNTPVQAIFWPWLELVLRETAVNPDKFFPSRSAADGGGFSRSISYANTYNLYTWFQSKLLHIYFNITIKDRSV